MRAAERRARRHPAAAAILTASLALVLAPGAARANGAFPDSQSILTLAARPHEIALVTNFGVVLSEDDGHTWLWSCEQAANALGYLYQYGPPPRNRMFALAGDMLVHSDDGTCGWQAAGGLASGRGLTDFFPDPSNADRVLAVAFDYVTKASSVLASGDAGATFDATLYTTAARDGISGVEIARADPRTIYITTSITATKTAVLARSADGGVTWKTTDLSPALGPGMARIVAVDPNDAGRVLLLFQSDARQSLALTRDGGATVEMVLAADGYFTSYARTPAGTILIGGSDGAANPVLFASHDGGATFALLPNQPPHIRALAARGPNLYAATDNFGDGYALGLSTDEGLTWRPLMSYDKMNAIVGCLKSSCQEVCAQEVTMGLWSAATCSADAPIAGSGADAGSDGDAGGRSGDAGGGQPPRPKGGSCAVSPGAAIDGPWWLLFGLFLRYEQLARARARARVKRLSD